MYYTFTMKQKNNTKGILNTEVSRITLRGLKEIAARDGRTLQWVVDRCLAHGLECVGAFGEAKVEGEEAKGEPVPVMKKARTTCRRCEGRGTVQNPESQEYENCTYCDGSGFAG